MSLEHHPKNRVSEGAIVRVLSPQEQERRENTEAQNRLDALLFEYIIRHPERLKKWLDQGHPED